MEKNKIGKTDVISWVKDKWAHNPMFSTLIALLCMVLVQSVVMGNLAGSFGGSGVSTLYVVIILLAALYAGMALYSWQSEGNPVPAFFR